MVQEHEKRQMKVVDADVAAPARKIFVTDNGIVDLKAQMKIEDSRTLQG